MSNGANVWQTWAGLAACGMALAGALTTGAGASDAAAPDTGTASARPAAADCPPGELRRIEGAGTARDDGLLSPAQAAEYQRMLADERVPHGAPERIVSVVVHVITAEDGTGAVSDAVIDEQIGVLDRAFGGGFEGPDTGFRFQVEDVTRTADDAWFSDFDDNAAEAQAALHTGGADTLNLYTTDMGDGVLGRSSFPQEYAQAPERDGVVIDYRTVPGGGREGFDLGQTATHETGHWLGLFHTFQNGCSAPGDYVDDTPYEREQSSGCPEGRDTCPNQAGDDPVTNFMDYSDDACMTEFTEGQSARMADHWYAFRG